MYKTHDQCWLKREIVKREQEELPSPFCYEAQAYAIIIQTLDWVLGDKEYIYSETKHI